MGTPRSPIGPVLVGLSLLPMASPLPAADAPGAATGELRLPSGVVARYEYHFDRNSLRDSRRTGDALIALTSSRNLLRFDPDRLRPTRERFEAAGVTCLGQGDDGAVLAGFEDGRICRVDAATLELDEVARLAGRPTWIGVPHGGGRALPVVAAEGKYATVHDLAKRKTFMTGATTFLLDRRRRLWMGSDDGEWGGSCSSLDLESGTLEKLAGLKDREGDEEPAWDGVYGFAELGDGQVWAFGGTAHMVLQEAFIRRVDRGKSERLYYQDNTGALKARIEGKAVPRVIRPVGPITQVVEDQPGSLLVFSYSQIYRTDASLSSWRLTHELGVHYRWGRPDAVGAYPAVTAVHAPARPADGLLCATIADGYVRVADGKETQHAVPGQLGARRVLRIEDTAEGILLMGWGDDEPPWRLRDRGWEVASLAPPDGRQPRGAGWYETRVLVAPGGTISTVSAEAKSPGTRLTARRRGGRVEILGREESSLKPSSTFITPDGELWAAGSGELSHFRDGKWRAVGKLPGADQGITVSPGLRALGDDGPPWILLDQTWGHLLGLDYGPGAKDPRLTLIPLTAAGEPLLVDAVLPWSKGVLLLATSQGLRTYEPGSGRVAPAPLPAVDRGIKRLCRDGLGRLWLGGGGLWMVDPDGKSIHDFAPLPMTGRPCWVPALAADPGRRDGIIASLGDRGVLFLRATPDQGR